MFRYFLHGFKMIVPAAGVMPLFAKGRRKRPEETWWVLITDVLPSIISHQTFSKLSSLKQFIIITYASVYGLGSTDYPHLGSPEWLQSDGLVLGTTEGFPGLRVQGDSLMWLSWCCQWAGNSAEMPTLPPRLAAGFWEGRNIPRVIVENDQSKDF